IIVDSNYFKSDMGINLTGISYSRFTNNTLETTGVAGMIFGMAAKNIIEGNQFSGSRGIFIGAYGDFIGSTPVEKNYIVNNYIEKAGDVGNDGEMIDFDNFADVARNNTEYYGEVHDATETTLTFSNVNFKPNAFKGHYVTVVEGRGLGQWRRIVSNTSETMT